MHSLMYFMLSKPKYSFQFYIKDYPLFSKSCQQLHLPQLIPPLYLTF